MVNYTGTNHHGTHYVLPNNHSPCQKCYKALIDSGAVISIIRYSTYQLIDESFKTPIHPTTTTLSTADGSSMTALGMTGLHLRIADFKFIHNFIICDRLPDTEIIFGIDVQKKFSLSYTWDKEKNCYIQKVGRFLTYTWNCEQKVTIGIVKSTLKIPPRHNSIVPIKSKATQSQYIQHALLAIKNQQKENIPT